MVAKHWIATYKKNISVKFVIYDLPWYLFMHKVAFSAPLSLKYSFKLVILLNYSLLLPTKVVLS